MTRRDTIIVAALVNAGLLVVLFVSALKNEEGREEVAYKSESIQSSLESSAKTEPKRVVGDEIDQVLRQYTATETPSKEIGSVSSFVEDLSKSKAPAAMPTAPTEPTEKEHVVEKGDMLEKIARRHKTSVSKIMKLNHLSSTQLKVGQVLKIPAVEEKVEKRAVTQEKTSLDPTSAKYYIVKPGDNPWTIAVKNHIKVEDLLKLNNMNEEKARRLRPGDEIRIQ